MSSQFRLWVCCASLVFAGLCGSSGCHPTPVVVAPPPAPPPPAPPPPPPPPKCEALTENCVATDATLLGVGARGATLTPPSGWKFAKLSDRSVAVSAEGKSLLAVSEISTDTEAAIFESLEQLLVASAVEKVKLDALKKRFKKPQITVDANGTKVDLWEVSKSTSNGVNPELREQGTGTLLVFVAHLAADRVVTGLGFVVTPDAEPDAEKVMHAVQTLKATP